MKTTSFPNLLALLASLVAADTALAATYQWNASSGLFPDQVAPAMTLFDGSSPENPQLSSGVLTIQNDAHSEYLYYAMADTQLSVPTSLSITAEVRFVSGTTSFPARTGAIIAFTTAPGVGGALYFGADEIFLQAAGGGGVRGPSANVDTDGAFHIYRIETTGTSAGSSFQVFQDNVLQLNGTLYASGVDFENFPRILFGEASSGAAGTSEWKSFSHNAATNTLGQTIFGLKSKAPPPAAGLPSEPPAHLFSFSNSGTGFTDLGAVKLAGADIDADGLAISTNGDLRAFQLSIGGSTLIALSPNTAVATTLGSQLSSRDIRGAVFDAANNLYAIDAAANELLQINPSNGAIVGSPVALTLGGNPFDLSSGCDIAIRQDGTFFLTELDAIYTLNPNAGVLTSAFTDPGTLLPGATFSAGTSSALFAYEVNDTDDIFRYDPTSGFSRTTVFANILSSFNSGRGDLAAIVAFLETNHGAVQVNITPPGAVGAGAQWQVDGGAFQNSGAVVTNLSAGNHTIVFKTIAGWVTPGNQIVTVIANTTNTASGTYSALATLFASSLSSNIVYRFQIGSSGVPVALSPITNSSLRAPIDVVLSPNNELFVVDRAPHGGGTGLVSRFLNPAGAPVFNGVISNGFDTPVGAVFRGGELLVTDAYHNRVRRFTFDGSGAPIEGTAITSGLSSTFARYLVLTPSGNELLVTECCTLNDIRRYSIVGDVITPNGTISGNGLNNPHCMAFSPAGELFVGNADGNSISRFTFSNGVVTANGTLTGNNLAGPVGVAFSPWGELFVANYLAPFISRWTISTNGTATTNAPMNIPTDWIALTFLNSVGGSPVPVQILSPQLAGTNFTFSFATANGQSYTVQRNDDLNTTNWVLHTNFIGDGLPAQIFAPVAGVPHRFFRVRSP